VRVPLSIAECKRITDMSELGGHLSRFDVDQRLPKGARRRVSASRVINTCDGCSSRAQWPLSTTRKSMAPREGHDFSGLMERRPTKMAAVALANKMARIVWRVEARDGIPHLPLLGWIPCWYFSGARRRFALCSKANIDPGSSWSKKLPEPSELDDVLGG
jgi:hypothetical protein